MLTIYSTVKRFFSVLFVLTLLCKNAKAVHIAASDLQVTYIGGGIDPCNAKPDYKYRIIFTEYLACEPTSGGGTNALTTIINYGSVNGGASTNNLTAEVTLIDHTTGLPAAAGYKGEVKTELCPSFQPDNSCSDPNNYLKYPGFRKFVYVGEITLPSPQTDWKFWRSTCCRNNSINNINSVGGSFYIEAGINNLAKFDVSTPQFTSNPLPYICVNVPFQYLNGPLDIDVNRDGNYLQTYSQAPFSAAGTQFTYQNGATAFNPIKSSTGFTVNPVSGTASFTPTQTGYFVLAFRCDKLSKDGTLLAYTTRDVQVSVLSCSQEAPSVVAKPVQLNNGTWMPVTDKDSAIYVCPGSELSFNLSASTPQSTKQLYWSSNNDLTMPGSNFVKSGEGTNKIAATIRWTPTKDDIGDQTLIVYAKDSTCDAAQPIVLSTPIVIVVRVVEGLNAGPDLPTCQYNPKGYQLRVKGTYDNLRVTWSSINGGPAVEIDSPNSPTPIVRASGHTDLIVTTSDLIGKCKNKDTVTLYVDKTNSIDAFPDNPVILCRPNYIQLDAEFKGKYPLHNLTCGIDDPVENDKIDSTFVYGSFVYDTKVTYDTLGANTHMFSNAVRSSKQQFLITKDELKRYGMEPSTIKALSIHIADAQLPDHEYSNFTISLKCTNKKELKKSDGFETGMIPVYTASGATKFPKGWNEFKFNTPYNWDSTQNIVVEFCYRDNANVDICYSPVMTYVPTGYISGLVLKPSNSSVTDVCTITTSAEASVHYSRPLLVFAYSEAPDAPLTYTWHNAKFLSDSTIQSPLAYVNKSTKYIVESYGRNGCKVYDTVDVYVPTKTYTVSPADTSICFGESPMITAKGGFTYKWWEYKNGEYKFASSLSEDRVANPIASPKVTTTYKIVVYDSVWCTDTIETKLTVMPLPEIRVLTPDTILKYGQSVQLMVAGARTYNWMPAATLSTPFSSNPLATPIEPTSYIVGGIGANGCRSFDTIQVGIDYKDNLFIPTAFSPNGDGRNDLFKITNLTFQKVTEFRVFNRWGQEVFATNGNKDGWDGSWKGVPQDLGNYSYQIRIAFPDGAVETYKGEVTLVR